MSIASTTKPVTVATHNGTFHADDVFGVSVLLALHPEARLIRTRDEALIAEADFAVDVGGVWDASRGRFDHHQRGFEGARPNGVVYASAGLVWAAHGLAVVEQLFNLNDPALSAAIADDLDVELVQHLDRADTGTDRGAPGVFGMAALLGQLNITWDHPASVNKDQAAILVQFRQAADVCTIFWKAALDQIRARYQGAQRVRESERACNGAVLVLPRTGLPWAEVVCSEMPEVLYVVYPDSQDRQYQLHVVTVEPRSFDARKDLPKAWAGLRDAELAEVTGVPDAVFCHNGLFIAGAGSLSGALRMAEIALQTA